MKGYTFEEYPGHNWCRETGSTALVCLHCGANLDYHPASLAKGGPFFEPKGTITPEILEEFGRFCSCGSDDGD